MKKENSKASSRRDFIKTAGKFAVYTPPALVLMTKPGSDAFGASLKGKANLDGCTVPGVARGNPNCDGQKDFPGG